MKKIMLIIILIMMPCLIMTSEYVPDSTPGVKRPAAITGVCHRHQCEIEDIYGDSNSWYAEPHEIQTGDTIYYYCPLCVAEQIHKLLKKQGVKPLYKEELK